jgi:hypothetical protein
VDKISHNLKEYSEIKGVVFVQPDTLFAHPDHLSADKTVHHTDTPIGPERTSCRILAPNLSTRVVDRSPATHFTKDKPRPPVSDALEGDRSGPYSCADTPCCPPNDNKADSSLSCHSDGEMPNRCQHIATPRLSSISSAPPLVVNAAPNEATPPSHPPTNTQPSETAEAGETFKPTDDSQSLSLACGLASAPIPCVPNSREPMSPASSTKHPPGLTPSFSLPESPLCEPPLASQNALAAVGRKRKRRDNNLVGLGRQHDLSLISIAAKISNAILLGGRKYDSSTFEAWEQDLWLLNPDRAKLTLAGLLTQQRTYTEALLCQGIVARIIHSWCLIAYEYRLSTVDRRKSARRNQKEIRLSLRCRKLGILFLEIINKLFAQPSIGIDAYKACAAIAGKCSSQYLPAIG